MLLVFHVVISLIAIASGAPVMYGLLIGRAYNGFVTLLNGGHGKAHCLSGLRCSDGGTPRVHRRGSEGSVRPR